MKKLLTILSLCFSLSAFANCPCENGSPAEMEMPVAQEAPAANETDNSGNQESAAVAEQETKNEVQS